MTRVTCITATVKGTIPLDANFTRVGVPGLRARLARDARAAHAAGRLGCVGGRCGAHGEQLGAVRRSHPGPVPHQLGHPRHARPRRLIITCSRTACSATPPRSTSCRHDRHGRQLHLRQPRDSHLRWRARRLLDGLRHAVARRLQRSARSIRSTRTTRCSPTAPSTRVTPRCRPRRSTSTIAENTGGARRHQRRRVPLADLQDRRPQP